MKKSLSFMHDLGKPELDAVAEVLANPILTTGAWVERFEKQFRRVSEGATRDRRDELHGRAASRSHRTRHWSRR